MDPRTSLPGSPEELERFAYLQTRLPDIWNATRRAASAAHTSVVVPSLSFDSDELAKVKGVNWYEERLLFTLIRLRDPAARVLYVTSQPIHPEIIDYYLQLLAGVPASHARRRLGLLCMHDTSSEPLTQRILRRPRVIRRMRDWIGDPERAYLTCFHSTPLERSLAVALGIPLNAADPAMLHWGSKSGSRQIFTTAGVLHPAGYEELRSLDDVIDALVDLSQQRPGLMRAVIKLNDSFSGEGNALYAFPPDLPDDDAARRESITAALSDIRWTAHDETAGRFFGKFADMGGIVEEYIEADELHSPSVQMRITPVGEVTIVSTHDQVLGGATSQVYLGCRFPARESYRQQIQDEALKIGKALADVGVVSRFGIDFVVSRRADGPWRCHAIEINLRMGGTTHPFLALQFLTGGTLDPSTGQFLTRRGEPRCYFATDTLTAPSYRGLLPEDLMDILVANGLQFRPSDETGTLFHMIGALSQFGKVGVTCVGTTRAEADELYSEAVATLDRETGASQGLGGRPTRLLDARIQIE